MESLEVLEYQSEYIQCFYDLNVEWLKTYFYVEDFDEEVLSNPNKYILNKGGHIFFAKKNNDIVGTVALMPLENQGVFELTKMAVSPSGRGQKIGQILLKHCIDHAKFALKLQKLILYSNTKLESAIYIYRKFGFIEIPIEPNSPYKRSNIKMELIL